MKKREAAERAAVIAEAMTWRNTRFSHRSSVKIQSAENRGGVDCAQFIRCVFAACGVIPDFDPPVYPSQWHLHRSEEWYLEWIEKFAVETMVLRPATVAIWKFGRCFSHAGILVDAENVIHAFEPTGYVAVDPIRMGALSAVRGGGKREVKFFDVWDKRRA
jgi:cell wall-associated NlpC family hydrolase